MTHDHRMSLKSKIRMDQFGIYESVGNWDSHFYIFTKMCIVMFVDINLKNGKGIFTQICRNSIFYSH